MPVISGQQTPCLQIGAGGRHQCLGQQQGVHGVQALDGFAQRTGRQAVAVAQSHRVHHHQFQRAGQGGVLQAIVGNHHVQPGVGAAQQFQCLPATAAHGHRQPRLCQQQGLVSGFIRGGTRIDQAGHPVAAGAIAAGQQAHLQPLRGQQPGQCDDHGCLARTAHHQVAHHDHGRAGAAGQAFHLQGPAPGLPVHQLRELVQDGPGQTVDALLPASRVAEPDGQQPGLDTLAQGFGFHAGAPSGQRGNRYRAGHVTGNCTGVNVPACSRHEGCPASGVSPAPMKKGAPKDAPEV